jgi:hypothetical protein
MSLRAWVVNQLSRCAAAIAGTGPLEVSLAGRVDDLITAAEEVLTDHHRRVNLGPSLSRLDDALDAVWGTESEHCAGPERRTP